MKSASLPKVFRIIDRLVYAPVHDVSAALLSFGMQYVTSTGDLDILNCTHEQSEYRAQE
jgi:hypothetical protein